MKLQCCRCGDGIESGNGFIPIEPAGTPNRKWVCTSSCANLIQKQQAGNALGKDGLKVSRIFSPNFLLPEEIGWV